MVCVFPQDCTNRRHSRLPEIIISSVANAMYVSSPKHYMSLGRSYPPYEAMYRASERKSVVTTKAAPLKIVAPTSSVVCVILMPHFIKYRMRTSYKRLRHTNSRYNGAASVALRRVARKRDGQSAARVVRIGGGIRS
eukprot:6190497-Pleurochrysis_carterae.AAC.4